MFDFLFFFLFPCSMFSSCISLRFRSQIYFARSRDRSRYYNRLHVCYFGRALALSRHSSRGLERLFRPTIPSTPSSTLEKGLLGMEGPRAIIASSSTRSIVPACRKTAPYAGCTHFRCWWRPSSRTADPWSLPRICNQRKKNIINNVSRTTLLAAGYRSNENTNET